MMDLTRRDPDDGARESVATRLRRGLRDIPFDFGRAFTLAEVSDKLGISLRQVQALIDDRSLAAVDVGRGKKRRDLRVLDDDLEGFTRRRRLGGAGGAFVPPEAAPHRKPDPEPQGYAERRAARLAAKAAKPVKLLRPNRPKG